MRDLIKNFAQATAAVDTSSRGVAGGTLVDKVYEGYLLVFLADALGLSDIFGEPPSSLIF